jgi:Mitochondrial-associated sphingomyelin phosphodiesterase
LNSNFFAQSLIEHWLSQNERSDGVTRSQKIYIRPNKFQIYGVTKFVGHLFKLKISKVTVEAQRIRSDISRLGDDQYELSKGYRTNNDSNAYRSLRPKLYTFLRLAFENLAGDEIFGDIIELWLLYLTPWKFLGEQYSEAWSGYVHDNFLFYTRLLYDFLKRTHSLDIYDSAMPLKDTTTKQTPVLKCNRSKTHNSISMIEQVMHVFADEGLMKLLVVLETALCSLDPYSVSNTGDYNRHSSISLFPPSTPRMDRAKSSAGFFQNSGPKTRGQIIELEGSYQYHPVFVPDIEKKKGNTKELVFMS